MVGIRDEALLLSALARPQNLAVYDEPDLAALAASYAFGISSNHPFMDGNKRTAWVVAETFLSKNGHELFADDGDALTMMLALADGSIAEAEFALWLRNYIRPITVS